MTNSQSIFSSLQIPVLEELSVVKWDMGIPPSCDQCVINAYYKRFDWSLNKCHFLGSLSTIFVNHVNAKMFWWNCAVILSNNCEIL